jgi:hypothetical protein
MENPLSTFQLKLRLQRYAENTIRTYTGGLSKFLQAFQWTR